ncbi:MAG: hypothetical protein ABIK83_13925, partial [Candidatus Zixiibacteriota bacterium]
DSQRPRMIIQLPSESEIEDLAAWILEPMISTPGPILGTILQAMDGAPSLESVAAELKLNDRNGKRYKEDWELHENLAWESLRSAESVNRATRFMSELCAIASGKQPDLNEWTKDTDSNITRFVPNFISHRS